MTLYVLDTDQLTLLRRGHPEVTQRVAAVTPSELAITVITVEEQLTGWYTQIRKARSAEKLARAYDGLFQVVEFLRQVRVLPFTRSAVDRYLELRKALPRAGKLDLSIAAIVLDHQGILISRNRQDFENVPGLPLEDWAQAKKE